MDKRVRRSCLAFASMLALAGCSTQEDLPEASQTPQPARTTPLHSERGGIGLLHESGDKSQMAAVTVNTFRSLIVTETAILGNFTMREVFDQLATQSGVAGLTGLAIFRQLWDTQNQRPGLNQGQHCNDLTSNGQPTGSPIFNSFPYLCRAQEGAQASQDPFTNPNASTGYKAVGLFNRFDLAPADGSNCGEYRIVFARKSGETNALTRNFIIFEAVLNNPHPEEGLDGCLPVAEFWQGLTANPDPVSRAQKLRTFYFQGLPGGFRPVVHIDNYGADPATVAGQIRTNQFLQSNWLLREFKLQKTCNAGTCTSLKAIISTDKVNPFGGLFNPTSTHARASDFRFFFATQVEALARNDINLFNMDVQDQFNGGQSDAQGGENNYTGQFGSGASALRTLIQNELDRIGSPLTPVNIVARAKALSCAGCHDLSNSNPLGGGLTWPNSLGFTHVSELTEAGPEGTRFRISPALENVFLPHRKAVFEAYLSRPRPCHHVCNPGNPIEAHCSPCAAAVCEGDPFCCLGSWDVICVDQAQDVCNVTCN
ncbi:hypothetical protein [Myxococcus qinghaiensis]|uniref:hypothetical protein n=1 Tax=Myxococcus qinghaiensis TaxID=2906758 RepID=UPI0020A7C495|nr:hypothetical protein [Myxococcus qinghaiensis]MCP3165376.1 hypothetical protein [Myxococcus qinghaiensis]